MRLAMTLATAVALVGTAAAAADGPKPLFASPDPLRLTISGPIGRIVANRAETAEIDGTLTAAGSAALPVKLSPRGITRRSKEVCRFPPLRVAFPEKPPSGSSFKGQKRLKLVTHCQPDPGSQQQLLLEYAAYRIYNLLTPKSFSARLAMIDYVDPGNRSTISRLGFFIEDADDVAHRNGLHEAKAPDRIPSAALVAEDAARFAVFEYLIGNLDWAMNGGPAGTACCHNAVLIGAKGVVTRLAPVPYDFDYSGLVDAPYAVPPKRIRLPNVRARRYRGFCGANPQALAAAAEIHAKRAAILGVLDSIPQLDARRREKAHTYLNKAFDDVSTPAGVAASLLRTCI